MANGKTKRQQVLFEYLIDEQAKQKIGTVNKSIEDGFDRMQKAIVRGGVAGTQELKKLEKGARDALKDVRDLRSGMENLDDAGKRAFDAQIESIKDFQKQIKLAQGDVRDFDEEFSEASRQVALAGDVETGARTLGGAAGAFGGAGGAQIERGVAVLSEIPASLEAIGRLKPALAGLPDAIKSVSQSLGKTGLGLGIVAIGAAIAFSELSKRANEAKQAAKELAEQLASQAETAANLEQALQADDFASAAQQVRQTQEDLINAQLELGRLEADRAEMTSRLTAGDFQLLRELDALDDKVKEAANDVETLTGDYDTQIEVLGEYDKTLADVEAALAETNEAEKERVAALIASAEATRARFLGEQALLEQSTEQLNDRLQAIENERTATKMAISELEKSNLTTEELTSQLDQYNSTLESLSQEQAFINQQALETARVREAEAAAEEKRKEQAEDRLRAQEEFDKQAEESFKQRAKLEQDYADDLVDISEKAAEESEKALEKLQQKLADLNRDLSRDLSDQQRKANRKELEAQIKAQRAQTDEFVKHRQTLADIARSADEEAQDLEQSRNFQGIFNLRRNTRRRIQEEQRNLIRRNADLAKDRMRARADRQQQFADERMDRMRKFQQDIADARQQYAQERALVVQNSVATVMMRRQQYAQEQQDLFQQGNALLRIRGQILNTETSLMQSALQTVGGFLSAIEARRAQALSGTNGFSAFGRNGATQTQTTTTNNINGNFTVNAAPNQSARELAKNQEKIFKGMLR